MQNFQPLLDTMYKGNKNPEQTPQLSEQEKIFIEFFNKSTFQLKQQIIDSKEEIKQQVLEIGKQLAYKTKNQKGIFGNNWEILPTVQNKKIHYWATFISWIQEVKAKIFKINVQLPSLNLIDVLANIRFTNLKRLEIAGNNISTIQNLHRNQWNQLQVLIIAKNHINSIKSLRKMKVPMITEIHLNDNHIIDLQYLIELDVPYLESIRLQWYPSFHGKENPQQGQSIQWLFRFQTQKLSFIRMHGSQRIEKNNHHFKICEKWVGCYIGKK